MVDLASKLRDLPARRGDPPWPGHEHVKGWGVIWHRDPEGHWSIYVDGARLDTACPRYYGPACTHVGHARIDIEWTGPVSLRVTMDAPRLDWTLKATQSPILRVLNAISPRLPMWTWRSGRLVRARELLARGMLHMGVNAGPIGQRAPVENDSAVAAG